VNDAGENAGEHLNVKETKVMSNAKMSTFQVKGMNIEVVGHFNLLGSIIEKEKTCTSELARRLALKRSA